MIDLDFWTSHTPTDRAACLRGLCEVLEIDRFRCFFEYEEFPSRPQPKVWKMIVSLAETDFCPTRFLRDLTLEQALAEMRPGYGYGFTPDYPEAQYPAFVARQRRELPESILGNAVLGHGGVSLHLEELRAGPYFDDPLKVFHAHVSFGTHDEPPDPWRYIREVPRAPWAREFKAQFERIWGPTNVTMRYGGGLDRRQDPLL